jgi:predicted mannosyl-3-phosphoglycerate phosphatase (HAD superfamily)
MQLPIVNSKLEAEKIELRKGLMLQATSYKLRSTSAIYTPQKVAVMKLFLGFG